MVYSSLISKFRGERNIVSEGYLLSDLAYARIRYELKKSTAFPAMMSLCKKILSEPPMKPDLYIILLAGAETIGRRQRNKNKRERNVTEFFRTRYYSALDEIHDELKESNIERLETDGDPSLTLGRILEVVRAKNLTRSV